MDLFLKYIPPDGLKILLTFLLSFLIGFEREEHFTSSQKRHFLGGVRTFPLIGLLGFVIAKISESDPYVLGLGLVILSGFMLISYYHKIQSSVRAGITSEISAIFTYFIGVLVCDEQFWLATTLVIVTALLLELKNALESLAQKVPEEEIFTFTKFLFLTAVILPVLPRHEFTLFNINPFKAWLVVVTISSVSYVIYVLERIFDTRESLILSAFLGGAYSSTLTTMALARRSHHQEEPAFFSGALLIASGMMYFRLLLLIAIFNISVAQILGPLFFSLGLGSVGAGALWIHIHPLSFPHEKAAAPKNPLEIKTALLFAGVFIVMMLLTKLVTIFWGNTGIYSLSVLTGLSDIDPFIMSLVQKPGAELSYNLIAKVILVASISNNFLKSLYTFLLAEKKTSRQGAVFLLILALLGILGLLTLPA